MGLRVCLRVKINRKKRTDKSDYKSIKDVNGNEINSPETFLKDIFTPWQLEPVEFLSMSEKEQNRILLNLIEFNKDKKEFIQEKFGEIPSWVNYDDSILEILNQLQSKEGQYYQNREDINRQIRNGIAIINDIAKDIPEGYDAEKEDSGERCPGRHYRLSGSDAERRVLPVPAGRAVL